MTPTPPQCRVECYSLGALTFDVVDSGPIDGDVVVLLHGFPQRASSWKGVTDRLNEAGYRTVVPDQRGYSHGARPRGRFAYRVDALVADTVALIEAIGTRSVHLVGHDWGACVAYVTAARHPSLVRSLTTISVPHPSAFVWSMLVSRQFLRSWYMAFFQVPYLPEMIIRRFPAATERQLMRIGMSRDLVDRFKDEVVDDGALTGAINYYRAMPLIGHRSTIDVPTSHVWSTNDSLMGRRGAQLNGRFVSGPYDLVVLDDASHWLPDESPDQLATVIRSRIESPAS